MPISTYRLNTKMRLTVLSLSGFELYSRWVPLDKMKELQEPQKIMICNAILSTFGHLFVCLFL